MGPKQIRDKYIADTAPVLARLKELADDDQRERDGLNRNIPPAQAAQERMDLRRRLVTMDAHHAAALAGWMRDEESAAETARLTNPHAGTAGYEQRRAADLAEADQMARLFVSRMGEAADRRRVAREATQVFGAEARRLLAAGDIHGAEVRLRASMLAGAEDQALMREIEAAKDAAEPHRAEAVRRLDAARIAYGEAAVERTKVQQLAALLAGDTAGAARSSAQAKLKAYDVARAKGQAYEQEVNLEHVGAEPKITVSGGG